MVKKIRVIEEEKTDEELDAQEFQARMLEYMQAMDWKLWEMLKVVQKFAEDNGYADPEETPVEVKTKKKSTKIKPVIVDEDDDA